MQSTKWIPLECLVLVAEGLVFWGPTVLKQLERLFLAGYHPRALLKQQTETHTSCFLMAPPSRLVKKVLSTNT